MPFSSTISRNDAAALIPEDVTDILLGNVAKKSVVMQLARRLRNMTTAQTRMPVLDALATAYFVTPRDTGLKQTTSVSWDNKYIDAEEIAAIVPIPEAVLDDASYDVWGQVRPAIEEAIAVLIDQSVLYGTGIPASWATNLGAAGIVAGALAAGHQISLAAYTDLYEAILGETAAGVSGLFGFIEDDGFMVNGSIAHLTMKRKLRNVRDAQGGLIFSSSMQQAGAYTLDGAQCIFPENGAIDPTYLLMSGAWSQLVYAVRQEVTYKILDQAVITDAAGKIVLNLPQQDMVALRAVIRLGFALPNPINRVNQTAATRFPFATLTA